MAPVNELDPALFDKIAIALTYAKLYPSIQKDFMGKLDCKKVHITGNMLVNTTGGPTAQTGPVTHIITQGGDDTIAKGLKAKYEAAVEAGDLDTIIGQLGN